MEAQEVTPVVDSGNICTFLPLAFNVFTVLQNVLLRVLSCRLHSLGVYLNAQDLSVLIYA